MTPDAPPTVLVVDDDPLILDLVVDLLQLHGYAVAAARDGCAALDWLAAHPPPFLILLDLMMPGMSGGELLGRLRASEATRGIPVAIMSGSLMAGDDPALPPGTARIAKPFRIGELIALIESHDPPRRAPE